MDKVEIIENLNLTFCHLSPMKLRIPLDGYMYM